MKSLGLALVIAIAACGGKAPPAREMSHDLPAPKSDPSCPLEVPGTSLSVEDTNHGAALVFVTTGDPTLVRSRAAKLADVYNRRNGEPSWLGMMFTAGSTATASEVTGGARVDFVAAQPETVGALQDELHMHGGHLTSGSCEM